MFVAVAGSATLAFAVLESEPTTDSFVSSTNPGRLSDPEVSWRWNWGNSLNPQLTIKTPAVDPNIPTDGIYYLFDQSAIATPTVGGPHLSGFSNGSMLTGTFDVDGIIDEVGWIQQAGAVSRGEGIWYLHFRYYNQFRASESVEHLHFGIDRTAPSAVQNLTAGVTKFTPTTGWTTSTRRVLKWTPQRYDGLSGVGGFAISVNGTETAFVRNVAPDPAYEWWARHVQSQLPERTCRRCSRPQSRIFRPARTRSE